MPTTYSPLYVAPRRLSETTRLVDSTVRAADACSCGREPQILVLRGFDVLSRERARDVRDRLRGQRSHATIIIEPAALTSELGPPDGHHCATVDARRRICARALIGYRWEPNQPDTGVLRVALDGRSVDVPTGAGIEVRVAGDGLGLWVIEDSHQHTARVGPTAGLVQVSQVDGIHLVYRDETLVGDSPAQVTLAFDERGGVRRVR